MQPTGGEGPETLFKAKVRKDQGGRALLFCDTETGERVFPVLPVLTLLEAYDRAVEAVEDHAGQSGAVVLLVIARADPALGPCSGNANRLVAAQWPPLRP